MVRLNTHGLNVPLNMQELKKLPNIPGTALRIKKKKNLSDMNPRANMPNSINHDQIDEDIEL